MRRDDDDIGFRLVYVNRRATVLREPLECGAIRGDNIDVEIDLTRAP